MSVQELVKLSPTSPPSSPMVLDGYEKVHEFQEKQTGKRSRNNVYQ